MEHRSLPSLGREEPALTSQSGQFPDFRPGEEREMESWAVAETEDWLSYEMPGPAVSLVETREYLVVCDNRDNVFYSSLSSSSSCLTWRRADYPASEVRSSRCGEIVWRLYSHTAFCLLQPQGWLEICRNVASLTLTESSRSIDGFIPKA